MNVVIYARYSSHSQNEQSIEGQLSSCLEFAKKNNFTVIREYIDRAVSATSSENRNAFLQMIEDSSNGLFEGVLVYQLDRFARNRYDSAVYKARLKKNGVRVLSARENISNDASGILVEGLLESMAEYYSAELSQKVKRGMQINANKCLYNGGPVSFGYRIDSNKRFIIDELTAPILNNIFQWYAAGQTVEQITEKLNSLKIKTSIGGKFNKNSLYTMLRNKRYIGIYVYNGSENPDGVPRIVSDELFYQVQDILEKNKKARARKKAKEEYLLTTKLFCGYCKEMMIGVSGTSATGKTYYYYTCNGVRKKECHKKSVQKEYIENRVVNECRALLTDENIDKIAREVIALCEQEKESANLKYLQDLLAKNEKAIENLMTALESGEITDLITKRIQAKSIESEEIRKQIAIEQAGQINITIPEIKFFLTQLKKGRIDDKKYRKALINIFVVAIYMFDDKVTYILNVGDKTISVDDNLLMEIEQANNEAFESSYIEHNGPPFKSK